MSSSDRSSRRLLRPEIFLWSFRVCGAGGGTETSFEIFLGRKLKRDGLGKGKPVVPFCWLPGPASSSLIRLPIDVAGRGRVSPRGRLFVDCEKPIDVGALPVGGGREPYPTLLPKLFVGACRDVVEGDLLDDRAAIDAPLTPFASRDRPGATDGICDLMTGSPPLSASVFRFGSGCGTVQVSSVSNVEGDWYRWLVLPLYVRLAGIPVIGTRALCCESVISWRHVVVVVIGAAAGA